MDIDKQVDKQVDEQVDKELHDAEQIYKQTTILYAETVFHLNEILKAFHESLDNIAIMCYLWKEYGFLPTIFNDYYRNFYEDVLKNKSIFIGLCFEGHEIFYQNKVDILVVLKGFIDTSKAYENNKETELFLTNINNNHDRGVAFLKTILNFDYVTCNSMIRSYAWTGIIYPSLFDGWDYSAVPYAYSDFQFGKGFGKTYHWSTGTYIKKWFSWNLDLCDDNKKYLLFDRVYAEEYDVLICKNSWKTRDYRSNNINDFLGTNENTREVGFISNNYVQQLCKEYIAMKKNLVVVNDLLEFNVPDDNYIKVVKMKHYLDVYKFVSLIFYANTAYVPPTAALDLALYYCSVDLKIISQRDKSDGLDYKLSFMEMVQNKNGKKWEVIHCI